MTLDQVFDETDDETDIELDSHDFHLLENSIDEIKKISKYKISKITLKHLDLLYKMFQIFIENNICSLNIEKVGKNLRLEPVSIILCVFYKKGLLENLKGHELLKYVKKNTIDFVEKVKSHSVDKPPVTL